MSPLIQPRVPGDPVTERMRELRILGTRYTAFAVLGIPLGFAAFLALATLGLVHVSVVGTFGLAYGKQFAPPPPPPPPPAGRPESSLASPAVTVPPFPEPAGLKLTRRDRERAGFDS